MSYKCQECQDTGNKEKDMGGYLTCIACSAATDRAALEAFVDKLPAMGEQEQAWRIHQRALAMAPPRQWVEIKDSAWVNIVNHDHAYDGWDKDDIINHVFKLTEAKCKELNGPDAAPAAANGAMPELPTPETMIVESDLGHRAYTADQMRAYGQACALAAAGPNAALVKAANNVVNAFNDPHVSLAYVARWINELTEEIAAISGAKGIDMWQPIETAPKNGTTVLTARPARHGKGHVIEGMVKNSDGWWVTVNGDRPNQPTHWQPLPEAP